MKVQSLLFLQHSHPAKVERKRCRVTVGSCMMLRESAASKKNISFYFFIFQMHDACTHTAAPVRAAKDADSRIEISLSFAYLP